MAEQSSALAQLQTPPSVDLIGAGMLLVEIDTNMPTFGLLFQCRSAIPSSGEYYCGSDILDWLASWTGVCSGNDELAGKRNSGRARKGNPYIRSLLCDFAHSDRCTTCAFNPMFDLLHIWQRHKHAIIAIAHKLLRAVSFVISLVNTIGSALPTTKRLWSNATHHAA